MPLYKSLVLNSQTIVKILFLVMVVFATGENVEVICYCIYKRAK
jgi:hypothetical protein